MSHKLGCLVSIMEPKREGNDGKWSALVEMVLWV